jgi:hypothetical protein
MKSSRKTSTGKPRSKRSQSKATPRVCTECGNHVTYLVANEMETSADEVAKVQAMNPNERNQHIAQAIIKVLGVKHSRYDLHTGPTAISFHPPSKNDKWTKSQQERIATALAPFARVAKKEVRVFAAYPHHVREASK